MQLIVYVKEWRKRKILILILFLILILISLKGNHNNVARRHVQSLWG